VLGPSQDGVSVVDVREAAAAAAGSAPRPPTVAAGSAAVVRHFTSTALVGNAKHASVVSELFTAVAWSADSSQLLVAGLHGSVYLLNK
jgi:hypothetical protein